jgi:hypothetical protein
MVVFQSSMVFGQWIKTNRATPCLVPFAPCLSPLPPALCLLPLPHVFCLLPSDSPMSAGGHKADIFMSGRTLHPRYRPENADRMSGGHQPDIGLTIDLTSSWIKIDGQNGPNRLSPGHPAHQTGTFTRVARLPVLPLGSAIFNCIGVLALRGRKGRPIQPSCTNNFHHTERSVVLADRPLLGPVLISRSLDGCKMVPDSRL